MKKKHAFTLRKAIIVLLINYCAILFSFSLKISENLTQKKESMIDVGGRKLHCCVYGKNSPSVVLISGFGALQNYWGTVIPDLSAQTTVITYDRAGIGKSEIGVLPCHGEQSARDLNVLLNELKAPKPYILVGHSYGGKIARLYTSMFPEAMGGLVLEDTQHEDILDEQRKILRGKDLEILEQMVARVRAPDNPRTEGDYQNATWNQLKNNKILPQIPFIVLTAGDRSKTMPPIFSIEAKKALEKLSMDMQKKLAALIRGSKHIVFEGVGHNIHIEKPKEFTVPIIEMINKVRKKK